MIGWLIGKVYEALFTSPDVGIRRAHILSKILLLVVSFLMVAHGLRFSLVLLAVLCVVIAIGGFKYALKSMIIVSSIPATWLALTGFIVSYTIKGCIDKVIILEIFTRTITISLSIALFIASLSPYELSNILWRLGFRNTCIIPIALWRLTPMALKDMVEAYNVQKLKGESIWKALAIATASMLEHRDFMLEYNFYKLSTSLAKPIPYKHNLTTTLLLVLASIVLITLLLIQ